MKLLKEIRYIAIQKFRVIIFNMAQFVKNIIKFMKRASSPAGEDDDSAEISKQTPQSRDKYLENKYKRVKIYNGETACSPHIHYAGANRNKSKRQTNTRCATPKSDCYRTDYATDSSTEAETNICRKRCRNSNFRKNEKCKKRECSNRSRGNSVSSTDTESESKNISKRKDDGDSCDHIEKKLGEMFLSVLENPLKKRFYEIEKNANALWNNCSTHLPQCDDCNANNKQWKNLNCMQKLPFYWAAISGDFLKETPYGNFLRFYLDEKGIDDKFIPNKQFNQHVQMLWNQLEENEKMPFVMESFMYRVSLGKVNMKSDKSIKDELDQIFNRTGCDTC